VTLKAGTKDEGIEGELLDYCRERLEYFQVPMRVTVVDSLPMTAMGKVDRLAVEAEVEAQLQERLGFLASRRSES
jgi:acyl-coenzyme A synthetase/AMP-(fatty) acid ligase